MIISNYDISQKDILKYLGYRGSALTDEIQESIDKAIAEVYKTAQPKSIYKIFPYSSGKVSGCSFSPEGKEVLELLNDSSDIILAAVSLGLQMDRLIRSWALRDLSYALILDTACSSAIEGVIEKLFSDLQVQFAQENRYLTDRFSPGYGDMPIIQQKDLLEVLNASRLMGLTVTQSGLLIPRKSITAIAGIANTKQPHRHKGCTFCPKFYDCSFRKRGITCYE